MNIDKEALDLHRKLQGKIELNSKVKVTKDNLKLLYTPGVASVVQEIAKNKGKAYEYTGKQNTIAIVSDGSRILGLGNVGAEAALPVMEGKSLLYKEYGNVNAIPLCIKTQNLDEIIKLIENISPNFGAINLEDIESPKCLDILKYLTKHLNIPVFHDDQHGTAIVVLSALLNALKLVKKSLHSAKIVIVGAGTAGYGITNLLVYAGAKNLILVDGKGILYKGRKNMNKYKEHLVQITNPIMVKGNLPDALKKSDVCIAVSGKKNLINEEMIKKMNKNSIVFALSNPYPEILPPNAVKAGARIVATGLSTYKNQVNNATIFPFLMKKILKERISKLDERLFYETAKKIASSIKASKNHIIPSLEEMRKVKL